MQRQLDIYTSGQIVPKSEHVNNRAAGTSFTFDGCSVSFTSNPKGVDDTIKTVKEILLSAYRTKRAGA